MSTQQLSRTAPGATRDQEPRSGSIVVGVDGSPTGRAALVWAVREARVLNAPLTLCHVHAVRRLPGARPIGDDFGRLALRQAELLASTSLGADQVTTVLRQGEPAHVLGALSHDARMLVVGTHGAFSRGAQLFPPFSVRIVTQAHCPVVAIPQTAGSVGPLKGHVVVAVDGSEPSRAALEFGFSYAERHDLPLAAVHITDEPPGDYWTDDDFLETHFTQEPRAETLLATEVEPWEARHPGVHVKRAVYAGRIEPGLLRAANGARLLVVGDRGRGLATTAVLGSVAEHMVGSVTCPVAVVKAP